MSLRHIASGEVMHSNVGPREEARLLYIEQSKLAEKLSTSSEELVLWDIGLGAATNALAALQCFKSCTSRHRTLRIESFESDLSGSRLALENRAVLPYFEGFVEGVETLLTHGHWQSDGIEWILHEGDFRDNARRARRPEIIFFDFYSPKTNPELWDVSMFKMVRDLAQESASLYTYSASTRVRVALLAAGFFVGFGRSTGTKAETTVAATRLELLENPLDLRWLERFKRSHEPLPHGWALERRDELFDLILGLEQFRSLSQENDRAQGDEQCPVLPAKR